MLRLPWSCGCPVPFPGLSGCGRIVPSARSSPSIRCTRASRSHECSPVRQPDSAAAGLPGGAMLALLALGLTTRASQAQGCMPLRFTSPNLGGQATSFLRPHEWQVGFDFRRVATHRFFVGTQETEAAAPGGQPLRINLNSVNLSAAYGLTERTSVTLAVPMSHS